MDPNTRQQRPKIKRKIENPADVAEGSNISSLSRLIAANPITSTPARDASVARTKRTMDSLQGVQANLASPTFGMDTLNRAGNSANTPSMMALGTAPLAVPGQAAGAMQYVANPRSAAGALGSTDQYNITTRRGASTPGPAMGNQGAISAAYAARNANHVMPSVPQGDRVAQGMSTDRLFPSPGDAEYKAKFEGIKLGRAAQKDKARDMRMQRAQWRGAIGYNSPAMGGGYAGRRSPIFDSEGNIDQMATTAASQMASNPKLSALATQANRELGQGDRRLSQLATQEANRDALAQLRFGLDETLGNAKITDMTEGRRIEELNIGNQFTLGQEQNANQTQTIENQGTYQAGQIANDQRRLSDLDARTQMERDRMKYEEGETASDRKMHINGMGGYDGEKAARAAIQFGQMPIDQQDAYTSTLVGRSPEERQAMALQIQPSPEAYARMYEANKEDSTWFGESPEDKAIRKARRDAGLAGLRGYGINPEATPANPTPKPFRNPITSMPMVMNPMLSL